MDVHHHSHAHGKRTWKSYFWEFTMLFLAVFCGFLAEYSLEHKIEKERGKQFIESFYEDLKTDTARISIYTNYDDQKLKGLDSLGACYEAITRNTNDASCLLEIIKNSSINRPFMRTDRTLKQLANAGGFRLLKRKMQTAYLHMMLRSIISRIFNPRYSRPSRITSGIHSTQ